MPEEGTEAWARWALKYQFKPDDALLIEFIVTYPDRPRRVMEYAAACHLRGWAGWQAVLAWGVVEALAQPIEDDIPF